MIMVTWRRVLRTPSLYQREPCKYQRWCDLPGWCLIRMYCAAPEIVFVLGLVLYDFNGSLHASLYLYKLDFSPSCVSVYSFYVENGPQESKFLSTRK